MSEAVDVPDVDPDEYRQVIGRFASGVTVVTTRDGRLDHAMTANALMSVSLDPVLLCLSVECEARFHDAVVEAGVWGVSILPSSARATAAWLSTRGRPLHGQLERIPHTYGPATGVPLLDDSLALLECRTVDTHPAGDHTLLVGHVVWMATTEHPGDALVYYRGQFGALP
ncbi:flavin reductase family protein [Leekyejoonella antrihumi]|uniref:Flavin reductase n=1 Tax=Leekyejoonella antrihumi TaxID=1660198 RepID=A0A563DWI3_9MICO|nr:flavin reductase family protein [Leekyejoonella antrihumi]TWP34565.1 flavin reductase [Leekyejoonella antrihumi]